MYDISGRPSQFHETGFLTKTKNHMLRTTLGLRDEASSDTVSTEFNYLQPSVRKIDISHRASINNPKP